MVRAVIAAIVLTLTPAVVCAQDQVPFDFPRLPGPTVIATHLTTDGETVWAIDHETFERLIAIDATAGVRYETQLEGVIGPLEPAAYSEGSVWIPDIGAGRVHQVDAATGRQLVTIGNGRSHSHGVTVLDGSLWLGAYGEGRADVIFRYDPVTGEEQARIESAEPVYNLIAAGGYVWINRGYTLARIDPATNQIQDGPPGEFDYDLWTGDGLLVATSYDSRTTTVIDAATGTVVKNIELGHGFADTVIAGGSLWIPGGNSVERIDIASGEIVTKYNDAPWPLFIRITGNVMWLVNVDNARAHEVQWFAMPAGLVSAPPSAPSKPKAAPKTK